MEICWDNLKGIKLTRNGVFIKNKRHSYIYMDSCKKCEEPYLTLKHKLSDFCGRSCALSGEGHPGYGKPLSDEHKLKLSAAFTGNKNHFYGKTHSNCVRDILRKKSTGRKVSLSTRKKMSESRIGKPIHSEEEKRKRSERFMGHNNPAWKGGISFEPYCEIWKDKEYKEDIKIRDNYRCINPYCSSLYKDKLVIHHINYEKKNCGPTNLITVCNSCNSKANVDREWHKSWYRAILHRRYGYEY